MFIKVVAQILLLIAGFLTVALGLCSSTWNKKEPVAILFGERTDEAEQAETLSELAYCQTLQRIAVPPFHFWTTLDASTGILHAGFVSPQFQRGPPV